MQSQMKESQENRGPLNNVDSDTSTRFAEFIYGGDYNTAEALVVLNGVEGKKPHPESDSSEAEADYPRTPNLKPIPMKARF